MSNDEIPNSACHRVRVDSELTIYQVTEVKKTIMSKIDRNVDLEIDLAEVAEIDTAGVQLLVFAKQEQERRQRALRLVQHSAPVLDAFELLGLVHYFKDPVVLTGKYGACHGS